MRQRSRGGVDVGLLDEQQQAALESALRGESLFISGGAGSGKSFTLLRIIDALRDRHGGDFGDRVAVSASTGRAALLIGGTTLHDVAGCGVPYYKSDFKKMSGKKDMWTKLEVLIIDEISMVSGEFLDYLDSELRNIRNSDAPFGGLQLIFSGDPFQIPPIHQTFKNLQGLHPDELLNNNMLALDYNGRIRYLFTNRGMFFHSQAYWELAVKVVELGTPHRQGDDADFVRHLSSIRGEAEGTDCREAIDYFNTRVFDAVEAGSDDTLIMLPTIAQVRGLNDGKLDELQSDSMVFEAKDNVTVEYDLDGNPGIWRLYTENPCHTLRSSAFFDEEHSDCKVVKHLELKVGARVMLAANLRTQHSKLVTGAIGTVTRLPPPGEKGDWAEVDFEGAGSQMILPRSFSATVPGWGMCFREQLPLQLAWAITHHRSQGMTLSRVRVDPYAFVDGLLYVALSRIRRIDGLHLMSPIDPDSIKVNPDAVIFAKHHKDPPRAQQLLGTWRDQPLPDECWERLMPEQESEELEPEDPA
ncbi:unnamed protein product [Prorocentrum cordatum]|uniref:ATP-dependent DNA helicase n=1 Tax=Prorocentrum cordatum TaxID=2364126 RepID=A0ABN9WX89_9DINO|nr:unnamed protein product [Polarella glacialis]|mmetsp:Transcript_82976/g.224821  ORF Transcript_82976/g.224821 Transcript_82976/m.224821 type:complete len:528 (+) Transcript_82976:2-1585(+)